MDKFARRVGRKEGKTSLFAVEVEKKILSKLRDFPRGGRFWQAAQSGTGTDLGVGILRVL